MEKQSPQPAEEPYRPAGPLDPVAAMVAQAFSAAPISAYPVEVTRQALRDACVMTGEPEMDSVADWPVPVSGGQTIALRLFMPSPQPPAVILWAHGGGFTLGSNDELDNFARALAARTGCAVASVEYRLAPEHRFPLAVEDVEAACLWLVENREPIGLAGAPVWLGGDSAGGNLATVVTRRLHTIGAAQIAGNVLAYPCTDSPLAPSMHAFEPPFTTAADVQWFLDQYLPGPECYDDPDFAPARATDLHVLPPTLIVTAEHDILTAQAESYAAQLLACGVKASVWRCPGMIHGFLTLDAFLPGAAGEAIGVIADFMESPPG